MSDPQWQNAVAQLAGVQASTLSQYIPDQPPPHVRFCSFSSGDVEIDRVGEAYDFVFVKRFRSERPGPQVLGPDFVVERPFLKMIHSYEEAAVAQVDVLRYLQGIRPTSQTSESHINPQIANAVDYGHAGEAFALANRKLTELMKIGVSPSLAIYGEIIRIGIEDGMFSEVVEIAKKAHSHGRLWIRVAEGLAAPLSREICDHFFHHDGVGSLPIESMCSPLLKDLRVVKALDLHDADRDAVLTPAVQDVARLTSASKALVNALTVMGSGYGAPQSQKMMQLASDVYASLLVQIYRSQEKSSQEKDDGIEAIAMGFFSESEGLQTSTKPAPAASLGVSEAGGSWLALNVLRPARELREVIRGRRSLTGAEEMLYSLLCLLASCGTSDSRSVPSPLGIHDLNEPSINAISLVAEAVSILTSLVESASTPETNTIQLVAKVFMRHFSANYDNLLRLSVHAGTRSATDRRLVVSSLFPNKTLPERAPLMLPARLWACVLEVTLKYVPLNDSFHVLEYGLLCSIATEFVPYALKLLREANRSSTTPSMDSTEEAQVVVDEVLDSLASLVVVVAGSWPRGEKATAIANTVLGAGAFVVDQMRQLGASNSTTLSLVNLAVHWHNAVTGIKCSVFLGVVTNWLDILTMSSDPVSDMSSVSLSELCDLFDAVDSVNDVAQSARFTILTLRLLPILLKRMSSVESTSKSRDSLVKLLTLVYRLLIQTPEGILSQLNATNAILELLSLSQDCVTGAFFTLPRCVAVDTAVRSIPLVSSNEAGVLLRHALLTVEVTPASTADDIVIQALTPRDTTSLGLSVSSAKPSTFYMMVADHTALDHLSQTNSCLPPSAVTMSTEVNAFASLMLRYISAGGVLLCIPPSALASCSDLSLKMLAQWWRQRSQWVGVMPHTVIPIAAREVGRAAFNKESLSTDHAVSFFLAALMKKGGCVKTAIITASPTAYTDALAALSDDARPSIINIVELLGKLVKK